MPSTRIIDISRRTIAIAITTGLKEETLLINVYAPATVAENNSFWSNFSPYISSCKSKCSGKVAVMIVGDLNATILKWHNGNSMNFINKNSKHITKLMDKYKLNLPSHKPTSHTFSRNIRSGSELITYEASLDHFLISDSLTTRVKKFKVIKQTIVRSDH